MDIVPCVFCKHSTSGFRVEACFLFELYSYSGGKSDQFVRLGALNLKDIIRVIGY